MVSFISKAITLISSWWPSISEPRFPQSSLPVKRASSSPSLLPDLSNLIEFFLLQYKHIEVIVSWLNWTERLQCCESICPLPELDFFAYLSYLNDVIISKPFIFTRAIFV